MFQVNFPKQHSCDLRKNKKKKKKKKNITGWGAELRVLLGGVRNSSMEEFNASYEKKNVCMKQFITTLYLLDGAQKYGWGRRMGRYP